MATYFGIVLCFLLAEARLETAFQVTRGQKDKFTNPECGENTDCTPSQCAQYFARCETKSCAVCICDEQNPTYVASEKRCVKDDDILSETVPEYSSFAISNDNRKPYLAASTTSTKLEEEAGYSGNTNQLWLYTPSKKLLNLKTFKCLQSTDGYKVDLGQCTAETNERQTWYCSSDSLYSKRKGTKSYLRFPGVHFSLGKNADYKWVASKDHGAPNRSICDIPDAYKGCYRYEDGSSLKRFSANKNELRDCKGKHDDNCYEKMRILAPIFRTADHECSLAWHDSEFSVNDQPWTPFRVYVNDFDHNATALSSGKNELQFHVNAKTVWAGALMKLRVECPADPNYHYILLKFDGVFNESLQEFPLSTVHHTDPTMKTSDTDSRYKSTAIALAVVLGVVLIIIGILVVLISRRQITRTWTTTNTDDDISAKPFCNDEQHL